MRTRRRVWFAVALVLGAGGATTAQEKSTRDLLAAEVIGPRQSLIDVREYLDARIPRLGKFAGAEEWDRYAAKLREDVLANVVFRGEAAAWRDAKTKVEWLDTIPGGPGYRIKKVRYEALPGMWVPALLYEPEELKGKVPVGLAVNGHDAKGKAAPYKQVRCINMARRGMLVLNVEWFGMGQLRSAGFGHGCMNQLDLCGTSGLAPFYLAMSRGLDLLLSLPNADPKRVAVSGLSGGGWQTIVISALDPRVTLANPVAGYSSFRTRIQHFKDLGDSEQTPCDLAKYADYTHLTAMRAPRPTLLTYNGKDNCCFEAGYALPPLVDAARPVFRLFDKEDVLRTHVDPEGNHHFEKANRLPFYRMIGDHFYGGDKAWSDEIPCGTELKTAEDLNVPLPADNADFNKLARTLARTLPRKPDEPITLHAIKDVVRANPLEVIEANERPLQQGEDRTVSAWKLRLSKTWTIPVVEFRPRNHKGTAVLINDGGRTAGTAKVEELLKAGNRVLAVDLFYFGESKVQEKDWLFAILLASVGDRPLGLQASQLAAVARWAREPVTVVATGPRSGLIALVAAGLEEKAVGGLELNGPFGSLKEVIDQNRSVNQMPEVFCFGLLEMFDVPQMTRLIAPRRVAVNRP
jgi:Acetyl xylan esterase (AXE1)